MTEIEYLKQENKKLVKALDDYGNKNFKYKRVLEEIRDILCKGRTFYEGYFDNPNLSRTDEAIKVINEVLNV